MTTTTTTRAWTSGVCSAAAMTKTRTTRVEGCESDEGDESNERNEGGEGDEGGEGGEAVCALESVLGRGAEPFSSWCSILCSCLLASCSRKRTRKKAAVKERIAIRSVSDDERWRL